MKSLKERLLGGVFRISRYHAWWVFFITLLITGFSVYYAMDVPLRSSLFDLLPSNDPLIDEYRENEKVASQSDYVALLVTLEPGAYAGDPEVQAAVSELTDLEAIEAPNEATKERIAVLRDTIVYPFREARLLEAAQALAVSLEADESSEFINVEYLQESSPSIPVQYQQIFELNDEELARITESVSLAQGAITGGDVPTFSDETLGSVYEGIREGFDDALFSFNFTPGGDSGGADTIQAQLDQFYEVNDMVLTSIEGLDGLPAVTEAVQALTGIFDPNPDAAQPGARPYYSGDRTRLLMIAEPRMPSQTGVEYSEQVIERVEAAIARVSPETLNIRVGIAGTYSFNSETNAVINADMLRTTIISSIGVFVIFFLAFGSFSFSLIAVVPLLISVVLTMAWAKFAFGGFNMVTTFLPALVLGMGIDYAIHMISRYAEERSAGKSLNRALYASVIHKGEASFVAAMTTSLVFMGMLTARSRALYEMGGITSVGVMIAFVVTIFLLPAMITLSHFLFKAKHKENISNYTARLSGFFQFVTGKGRAIFVIILVLTFFVAFQAAQTSFVFSSTDLVPRVPTQDVIDEIGEADFGTIPTAISAYFTFYAESWEELQRVVGELEQHDLVEAVDSAETYVTVDLTETQRVLNGLDISAYVHTLDALRQSLEERDEIVKQTQTLLSQFSLVQYAASLNGFVDLAVSSNEILDQLQALRSTLRDLDVAGARTAVVDLQTVLQELDENLQELRDLPPVDTLLREIIMSNPEPLRAQFLTPDGRFIIQARISREIYDADNLDDFDRFASTFSNDYFGMPLVAQQLENIMKRDFLVSTLLAIGLIAIVLWRSLRKPMRALLAASPLVLGYIWMLGGMRLMSIDFNFLSIIISPLLIGIGVDNGIHVLHRTEEERMLNPDCAVERASSATAVALIVTSFTTMLVFGSLLAARTPGLQMLGTSALLGIGFSLLFSLLFLPAAMRVEGGKRV